MNQALSTQIPQIGDSTQQLLARMAAAAADQNQQIATITWLPSAARTTTQNLTVDVPPGVKGVVVRLFVTAAPGVDTVNLQVSDGFTGGGTGFAIAATTPSTVAAPQLLVMKTGVVYSVPSYTTSQSVGLTNRVAIQVVHSGAGSFIYSATYSWLK